MARTQIEIKKSLTDNFINTATVVTLYGLTAGLTFLQQFSLVSLENVLFDTIAYGTSVLEGMWDLLRAELKAEMAKNQPHTQDWYRNKALGFMLGLPVVDSQGNFDTTTLTDDEINAAKVVKQAAAIKLLTDSGYGILRLKVATIEGDDLAAVPEPAFSAVRAYILRYIVDAGTQITISTNTGDQLKLSIDVYYDPLVLTANGARIDGTNGTPVEDAVKAFLKSLDFDGVLNLKRLEDYIEAAEGVQYAKVTYGASKYGQHDYDSVGIQNVGTIDVFRTADSGYFKLDSLDVSYKQPE